MDSTPRNSSKKKLEMSLANTIGRIGRHEPFRRA